MGFEVWFGNHFQTVGAPTRTCQGETRSNSHFEILSRPCRINAALRLPWNAALMRQRLQNELWKNPVETANCVPIVR
jgi:hypothetical protein